MDEKLKRFFDKIEMKEELISSFNTAQLKNVIVNKKEETWRIEIDLENMITIEEFDNLCMLSKNIKEVKKVYFKFNRKDNNKYLEEYFNYFFKRMSDKCPTLKSILDNQIKFENNDIVIEVLNKMEEEKINQVKQKLIDDLTRLGFILDIRTELNEEKRKELISEIKSQDLIKKEVVKQEDTIIIGSLIKGKISEIKDIIAEESNIILEVKLFDDAEFKETKKNNFVIMSLKITDFSDSINAKMFINDKEVINSLKKNMKKNSWYKMRGYVKHDEYMRDLVFNLRDIEKIDSKDIKRTDDAEKKRVELHLHTKMSAMDGLIDYQKDLFKKLNELGHTAVGVTDKNAIQAFPKLYKNKADIKVLFGSEIYVVNDEVGIVVRGTKDLIKDTTFVVFDFETTGFNAAAGDSIIEIGAVKIKNGEIIDRFNELVNPNQKLKKVITDLTLITDEMLKDKDTEENAFKRFMEFFKDFPMVAHNARFDVSFLEMCYKKYNLGEFKNTVIDTMELDKGLNPDSFKHSLSAVVKRYNVEFDEAGHHRADYDAEGTAKALFAMFKTLDSNIKTLEDLDKVVDTDSIHKMGRPYHITIYAKNNEGLKNLFKIVTLANTKYLYKTPRILKSEIVKLREGLIIGSGCINGEVFTSASSKTEDELINIMDFYDFIEVNPPSICKHLVESGDFNSIYDVEENIKKIINCADRLGKMVCATGDVHTLDKEDNIYREILVAQKVPGGGFHPLNRSNIKTIPNAYLMTTQEMLDEFKFIDKETAYQIVVENTNKIVEMVEDVEILKKELYVPKMDNSVEIVKDLVYSTARGIYGEDLPTIIEERIDKELTGIINSGFDVIYLIAQKLVKKSNDDGYLVGSRGSVGSSLVATFMGITEVNPLPAHYVCPKCKKSLFELDGEKLSDKYGSGFDLPNRICECGEKFKKQGQDIPFETFLGFNADKVPDIDLNFSGEYQAKAHEYTKVLFGEDKVYRAGTVSTIADKTAFGFVKGYIEEKGITLRNVEVERLAKGITGVKRTTGQHPGGIVVIPDYKEVFDFTAFQYPAENTSAAWYTTHFEYHDIEDNVLKLDILGHDDPTVLKYLSDETGVNIEDIPLDDQKVLSLFSSPEALGVTKEQINSEVGTIGVPEFGTNFVIKMLEETTPKTFAELIKISGLSHGTDVWNGNARDLILNKTCEFKEVVGCRDDIMVYLIKSGIEKSQAFKTSEFIRKGKSVKEPETWKELVKVMKEHNVPDWYIGSCEKIKYMFPKAHASAYVTMAFRVAWFKVYYPIQYYRVYLSIRQSDFDLEAFVNGIDGVKQKMAEISNKGYSATNKELNTYDALRSALEMLQRGFRFERISLIESDALMFKITEDGKGLIPPFIALDGMGDIAAKKIVEEREQKPFISIEDVQLRGKVSTTLIDKMRSMGVFDDLPESSQLSLF